MSLRCLALLLAFAGCAQTHRTDFEIGGESRVVTGIVRSDDGAPLRYTNVSARGAETSTDEFGRYKLEIPFYQRRVHLYVRSEGWAARVHELKRDESRVDFTLRRAVAQQGFVTDARGVPLGDVLIAARGGESTRSDRAGHFLLRSVESGQSELTAQHRDHPPLTVAIVAPDPGLRLTIADGVNLRVTIRSLEYCFPSGLRHHSREIEGGYELAALPQDQELELELVCPGETGQTTLFRQVIRPPIPQAITVDVPSLQSVRLELVDAAGRPMQDVILLFETLADLAVETSGVLTTDASGAATLQVPQGSRLLQFSTLPTGLVARRWWHGEPVVRLTMTPLTSRNR